MNLSVTYSLRDELVAALLLAFDFIRGLLQTGICTRKVNEFLKNRSARVALRCLPIIFSIFVLLVTTLRTGALTGRGRQQPHVSRSPETRTNSAPNTLDAKKRSSSSSSANCCMNCPDMWRLSEAWRKEEAYFAPTTQAVEDDFDSERHLQMCIDGFCSSQAPQPPSPGAHCS
ncbi:uncharacterized protein Tco025E_08430 [Trypanosoma conorhini]|uniref:Uncharacterized protein n=1 Tax=Trypanosoma conorhini TaxID=83891 RepID=A0A3R7K5T5_9TRYP|nr:uncharacterized protein Tco025E_08430 [Trypanosoma conorhini]RNF02214.1 hypothetical protein Tco025E_08430 [Trypanosoma conorhini]